MKMNKKMILIVAGLGLVISAQAQKLGRYEKNLLFEADIYYSQGDYYYAAELYTEISKSLPNDPEILGKIGICYFNLPTMKDQSKGFLELAVENNDTEALFYLARLRIQEYKFFDALNLIDTYTSKAGRLKSVAEIDALRANAQNAIEMVQVPLRVTIKNLGRNVNSPVHDYAPVWDNQGRKIYFTSRRRFDDKSEKDYSEQYDENIYEIDLNKRNLEAVGAGGPLNTRTNDAAVACSPDGKSLIFYRTSKNGFSGDLYITRKQGYTWSEPEKLDAEINSKYQEASASFGNNEGTTLYFSSDRPGGYGGKDIYKVNRLPDGSWSKAQNLGENINTPFDDDAPFISADGSLYFASQGHRGMGGFDIFCATINGDGFNNPINIGYPVNTPGDDIFFTLDPTGKTAYFSSERIGGLGLQDIYQVVFDDENSIIYRGELISTADEIPADATITLVNNDSGQVEGLYQTDPKSGTFILALTTNQNYTVTVEADGYKTIEKAMFFDNEAKGSGEVEEKLILRK